MGDFVEEYEAREKIKNISKQRASNKTPPKPFSEALTAQTLLARILKALDAELETTLMPLEIRNRLVNVLTSNDKNYRFARTNITTVLEYAIGKKIIK